MSLNNYPVDRAHWRKWLYAVIFESDTQAGRNFDIALLCTILFSILCVSLESVTALPYSVREILRILEWVLTAVFTTEYILRLLTATEPRRYATSFFGIVDLCSIIPSYVSLMIGAYHGLLLLRVIRLLRV